MAEIREKTPLETTLTPETEHDLVRKRKSKSPSLAVETKRAKDEDVESNEDIAKQYKRFKAAPKYNLNSEEVYCICRKPDHGGELMVGCDGCEEWFHFKCMKIDSQYKHLIDKFYCKFCQWKGVGSMLWNRKCRMPGCFQPIRKAEKSKYCSEECGRRYLQGKLQGSEVLTPQHIKFVLTYINTYDDLIKMGVEFPELPEVLSLDMEKLPLHIRNELVENASKVEKVQSEHSWVTARELFLPIIKEKIRIINERLQNTVEPVEEESAKKKKKKGSKTKKVDLCCFDKRLDDLLTKEEYEKMIQSDNIYETFKDEIDEIVHAYNNQDNISYNGSMCLQDRRKCLRHNGWFGLLTDQVWKRRTELENALQKLEEEKFETLRAYSILRYEEDK